MLSRALSLAAVTLLINCGAVLPALAQAQNLEAGKSPSQIFAGTCTACHKSPRGLLKTVSAGSLPAFLRQHYTTSGDMASLLSSFLISNGASDTRYQAKQGVDAKPAGGTEQLERPGRRSRATPAQDTARPDSAEAPPQGEAGRQGRYGRRLARPGEAPDAARPADGQGPAQAAIERGPDGRRLSAKQRLGRPSRPGGDESSRDAPPKAEPSADDKAKAETTREDGGKPESAKPVPEARSEPAAIDAPKENGGEPAVLRADPVPPVTPAPPTASAAVSAAVPSGTPEPAAAPPEAPATVTTSASPPAPPVAAAGLPAPPISK